MAKFYGKSSSYLKFNDYKYHFYSVCVVLLVLPLIWLVSKFTTPLGTAVAALVFILFLVTLANPLVNLFNSESAKYSHGLLGEAEIKQELHSLSDDYSVFQGIVLTKGKGDIDFIVVGPTGIFILEVKSFGGNIEFNGSNLTLNGRLLRGSSLLRQVHGEVWALKNYLQQETGRNSYIHPILVFASPHATMNFGYNPVSNVYIVQREFLLGLFNFFPQFSFPVPREKIERALLKAVSN
jgi:hypothetical protein